MCLTSGTRNESRFVARGVIAAGFGVLLLMLRLCAAVWWFGFPLWSVLVLVGVPRVYAGA